MGDKKECEGIVLFFFNKLVTDVIDATPSLIIENLVHVIDYVGELTLII